MAGFRYMAGRCVVLVGTGKGNDECINTPTVSSWPGEAVGMPRLGLRMNSVEQWCICLYTSGGSSFTDRET